MKLNNADTSIFQFTFYWKILLSIKYNDWKLYKRVKLFANERLGSMQ